MKKSRERRFKTERSIESFLRSAHSTRKSGYARFFRKLFWIFQRPISSRTDNMRAIEKQSFRATLEQSTIDAPENRPATTPTSRAGSEPASPARRGSTKPRAPRRPRLRKLRAPRLLLSPPACSHRTAPPRPRKQGCRTPWSRSPTRSAPPRSVPTLTVRPSIRAPGVPPSIPTEVKPAGLPRQVLFRATRRARAGQFAKATAALSAAAVAPHDDVTLAAVRLSHRPNFFLAAGQRFPHTAIGSTYELNKQQASTTCSSSKKKHQPHPVA